jgi:hypothetical protein
VAKGRLKWLTWRLTLETACLTAIGVGLWMAWPPLCPIIVGGLILLASILGREREKPSMVPIPQLDGAPESPFITPAEAPPENRIVETT